MGDKIKIRGGGGGPYEHTHMQLEHGLECVLANVGGALSASHASSYASHLPEDGAPG
jgi:hypothetical protein